MKFYYKPAYQAITIIYFSFKIIHNYDVQTCTLGHTSKHKYWKIQTAITSHERIREKR